MPSHWLTTINESTEPLWFPWEGPSIRIVLSSMVTVQRNVDGIIFPPFSGVPEQATLACNTLMNALERHPEFNLPLQLDPSMLTTAQRNLFRFHNLADTAFLAAPDSRMLLMSEDFHKLCRINDHNHLFLQSYAPDVQLDRQNEDLQSILATLSAEVPFAWDKYFGFICHHPELCGTGYTARIHLNLPGIVLMGYGDQAAKAACDLGFQLRFDQTPKQGYNTHLALLSACNLPNCTPQKINARLEDFLRRIVQHEQDARKKLCSDPMRSRLRDMIGRARAVVSGAYLMSITETVKTLALFWLAQELGYKVHNLKQRDFFAFFTKALAECQIGAKLKLSEQETLLDEARRAAEIKEFFQNPTLEQP